MAAGGYEMPTMFAIKSSPDLQVEKMINITPKSNQSNEYSSFIRLLRIKYIKRKKRTTLDAIAKACILGRMNIGIIIFDEFVLIE